MASKDHDIESQTGELVVDTGDEELRVGLLDLPALFIGIRLGVSTFKMFLCTYDC